MNRSCFRVSVVLVLAAFSSHARAQTGPPGFSAVEYAAGPSPAHVAIGDLNRDGKPDLVVANGGSTTVSVLLGDGLGAFGSPTSFGVVHDPRCVAIGDLDGDGNPDLAVASAGSSSVSILLGDGQGGFGSATSFSTDLWPVSVAIGDFDGDGKPDMAVAESTGGVRVFLGDGQGGIAHENAFNAGPAPQSVAIGDLNGDGQPDLVVANYTSGNVSVLFGDGLGGFGNPTSFAVGTHPLSAAIGDLNGDGNFDLAVTNVGPSSYRVSVLLGSGLGGFGNVTSFDVGWNPHWVSIGDLNADGKPDLVVANYGRGFGTNSVSVLLNSGTGSPFFAFCYGEGAVARPCPCGNSGLPGHGCENSSATGGALLTASGVPSLAADTVQLTSSGERTGALSIALQGTSVVAPLNFGDGLRCAGGSLKRLYSQHAIGGTIVVPQPSDPSISARSAMLGDPIPSGATRIYQVYYRDPDLAFCPGGFNVTNGITTAWGP